MQDDKPANIVQPNSTPETNWQFNPDSNAHSDQVAEATSSNSSNLPKQSVGANSVNWTASEFISHDKSSTWYLLLALAAVAVAVLVYFITKDKVPTAVVIIVAITFGVMAARRPRELNYVIDQKGVLVGEKLYLYEEFRSFAIVEEEGVQSIWLMPLKRFHPPLTIYFDPNDGQKIVDVLGEYLPIEARQLDAVDRLMHRLRF